MTQRDAKTLFLLFFPLSLSLLAASILVAKGGGLSRSDAAYHQIDVFAQVATLIENNYVEDVDGWELLYAGLRSMTEELDAYSEFFPPEEGKRFSEETHREYFGVGFSVRNDAAPITIDYLFEGSPAEKAGLRPGDRILAVDGEAVDADLDVSRATQLIKGPLGTRVKLHVRVQASGEEADFTVARAKIVQPTVFDEHYVDPEGKLAYLQLTAFGESTADEFDRALERLRPGIEDGSITGLILDLRFNQGGLVTSCERIANRFLREGVIVANRRRNAEESDCTYAIPEECWFADLPLVVLINRYSASASEILAGALQDHRRALLIGERSFGKGVVQSVWQIPIDEDHKDPAAVLKITTSVYLTPSGRVIEKTLQSQNGAGGLEPDIKILTDSDQFMADLQHRFYLLQIPAAYRDLVLADREIEIPRVDDRPLEAACRVLRGDTVVQDL